MSKAMPAYMYGDPCEAAMRQEAKQCTGCRHEMTVAKRTFCGAGRRKMVRCHRYDDKTKKEITG